MATTADVIVRGLAEHTEYVFGVGGANIEDLYDAVARSETVTGIVAKHEFGAGSMADGYARMTGRLGCVAATSGGGALNLVPVLGEAFESHIPMLALVGQPPTAQEGRGAFQDTSGRAGTLDAEALFGAVSRYCRKVTAPEDVPDALAEAIRAAYESRGPAVLLLPKDVQQAPGGETVSPRITPPASDGDALNRAISVVGEASARGRVVVIAGAEVARADARAELAALVDHLDATVAVTPEAKDAFPNDDPRYRGLTGVMGHPGVDEMIAGASLCLAVGTPLGSTDAFGVAGALSGGTALVHLGARPPVLEAAVSVSGPLGEVLPRLVSGLTRAPRSGAGAVARPAELSTTPSTSSLGYRQVIARLNARLAPGCAVIADAGNTGAAVIHHLAIPRDGRFAVALGMGGMGWSFGAGIGVALGSGRRTWVVAGDGAFYMNGHEVHTAVEHGAPVTFVVLDNRAHGMCVVRDEVLLRSETSVNRFGAAQIGASIGALLPALATYAVTSLDELDRALDAAARATGPVFISVVCGVDEIPPFRPFLQETP